MLIWTATVLAAQDPVIIQQYAILISNANVSYNYLIKCQKAKYNLKFTGQIVDIDNMSYFKYLSARDSVGMEQLIKVINEQECRIVGQQFSLALHPIELNEIKMKTNSNNRQYIYISSERELHSDVLSVDVT